MNINQFIEKAKKLSSRERALIARCLIASLDREEDGDVELEWIELAEQRYADLRDGRVAAVTWDDIKETLRQT